MPGLQDEPIHRRGAQRYAAHAMLVVVLAVAMVGIAAPADSSGRPALGSRVSDGGHGHRADRRQRSGLMSARIRPRRPLVFGIYPGGAAGTVGPTGKVRPEVAELRLEALRTLRGGARPFVVHLYDSYTEPADAGALPEWLESQIAAYTADGFSVELVLAYRPKRTTGDVTGFAGFVRARVRQLGGNPNVTDLQVTNEANVDGAPNAADGAYPGARRALVRGVIAADKAARSRGFSHLRIGFNWAYQLGRSERAFFSSLRRIGGRRFTTAVDWVGLDAYPGTWGPALGTTDLSAGVRSSTLAAIRLLRQDLLPRARLGAADLHVSESGYPTGPGRTDAMQEEALRAAVQAVAEAAPAQRVTGYRWFDLRDADSSSSSFESQYGLMRDDYSPKPAFSAYRELIAKLG